MPRPAFLRLLLQGVRGWASPHIKVMTGVEIVAVERGSAAASSPQQRGQQPPLLVKAVRRAGGGSGSGGSAGGEEGEVLEMRPGLLIAADGAWARGARTACVWCACDAPAPPVGAPVCWCALGTHAVPLINASLSFARLQVSRPWCAAPCRHGSRRT